MNISLEMAMSVIGLALSIGIAWGVSSRRLDDQKDKNAAIDSQLEKLWRWKDAHEADASEKRIEIMRELGKVESSFAARDGQFAEIMRSIIDVKDDLSSVRKDVATLMVRKGDN